MKTIDSNEEQKHYIAIENLQEKNIYDEALSNLLRSAVLECFLQEGFTAAAEISITLTDNIHIRGINSKFRNIDAPTDVLSFPMIEMHNGKILSSEGDYDLDEGRLVLGDIVISLEKAEAQAYDYGHSYSREVAFLTTHGVFHLLGYDHLNEEQLNLMLVKQEGVLLKLGLIRE